MSDVDKLPFHRKYRPTKLADYIGNTKLKESIINSLKSGQRPQVMLFYGNSGCGKAQPLDSLVLTIDGYKKMGDIEVGDEVFTHRGSVGRVSGIYPQGVRPIYRITLSDRTYIDVSDEHLNCVYRYNTSKKQREDYVLTTTELIEMFNESKYKLRIDVPSVDWEKRDIPVDAYLLGALIGDGCLSGGTFGFSNSESDIVSKVDTILRDKYEYFLNPKSDSDYDYDISSLHKSKYIFEYNQIVYHGCDSLKKTLVKEGYPAFDRGTLINIALNDAPQVFKQYPELRNTITVNIDEDFNNTKFKDDIRFMGLTCKSTEKFIPKEYLFNDRDTRLALLQGLFDTDGTISKNGLAEFSTSSKQLSDDFSFLVRSLGIRDTVSEKSSGYTDKDGNRVSCHISYRHFLKVPNDIVFFTSKKHKARYSKKQNEPIRNIESIERVRDQECQCIMVDHSDHTYISDYFIPTHNTSIARLVAKEYLCTERDNEKGACGVCYNCQLVDDYIRTGDVSNLYGIKEVDIASESGKRDLDAVVEDMLIPSFEWKIYILDECHEATSGAQNRLLKIVEEPPENVLIIFCTTNPEKMLETLRNRCQVQLKVNKPTVKELAALSRTICTIEDVEYDNKGLEFIAHRAECTIRSNLQFLERVINEQGKADYESATKIFEEVSNVVILKFFKALKSNDILGYVTLLHKIKTSMDLSVFLVELQQFVKNGIYVINGINLDGVSDSDLKSYRELFSDLGVAKISFLLNKLLSLDVKNLETELLSLGYSGLNVDIISNNSTSDSEIKSLDNECTKEQSQALKVIAENEKIASEKAISNADDLTQEASIEMIMQMGGILVE